MDTEKLSDIIGKCCGIGKEKKWTRYHTY